MLKCKKHYIYLKSPLYNQAIKVYEIHKDAYLCKFRWTINSYSESEIRLNSGQQAKIHYDKTSFI